MTEWLAALLLGTGGGFCLVAGIGVLRFRDVYARMHAATKAGTFGLVLIVAGAILVADDWTEAVEAAAVFLFLIATAPVGAHLIGRAAFRTRAPEDPRTTADPAAAAFRVPDPIPPGARASGESGAP